jgi:hypothetical protein
MKWYEPRTSDLESIEKTFNKNEKKNINFIREFQISTGQTW